MIIHNPVITGSFQINGSTISSVESIDNVSSSVVLLNDASASFSTRVTAAESSIDSLNSASSSYLLNTTDTLDGDLTVTGKITAQEFHTEFVSASIIYESGSTQFGNSGDDSHTFRGQLFVGAGDSENILTSKNYSALGQPEQLKIKHSGGSDVIQSLRGSLFLSSSSGAVVLQKEGGTVGIATSNPATPLQVHGNQVGSFDGISVSNFKTFGAGTGQNYSTINLSVTEQNELNALNRVFGSLEAGTWNEQSSNPGIFNFKVRSGGTPVTALTLYGGYDDNPKVGIGMSSPSWKLLVSSSNNLTSFFESSDTATIVGINNSNVSGDPQLKFYLDGIGKYTLGVDNSDGDKFKIATTDLDTNPRLVIDSGGNVGVGITTPSERLTVVAGGGIRVMSDSANPSKLLEHYYNSSFHHGLEAEGDRGLRIFSSTGDSSAKVTLYTEGSERMRINYEGHIGMSESNPSRVSSGATTLAIKGTVTTKGGAIRLDTSNYSIRGYMYVDSSYGYRIATATSHPLTFFTANAEKMRLNSNGNLGIGTTNPIGALHVNGLEIYGKAYSQTSTSGATSIIDTGIVPSSGAYEIFISGNANAGGSNLYRTIVHGYIYVAVDYTNPNVVTQIVYNEIGQEGGGSGNNQFTVSARILYNGTEYTEVPSSNAGSSQIRVKVAGYNTSHVGASQTVRITKRV